MSKKEIEVEDDVDVGSEEEEELTITDPAVAEKYRTSAKFANEALQTVIKDCVPGKTVIELCLLGDDTILKLCRGVYQKAKAKPDPDTGEIKPIQKGPCFPTCVNVDSIVCHLSPMPDDVLAKLALAPGNVVRIDLGVHIDGWAAVVAHTIIVPNEDGTPAKAKGPLANAVLAAQYCMDVAVHTMRPGSKNNDVTDLWEKIADDFGVTMCEGVLSHKIKNQEIDHEDAIISKRSVESRVEETIFEPNTVWGVDVCLSTGAGKLRQQDARAVVYRRNPETSAGMRRAAGRQALAQIDSNFKNFPFALRYLDPKTGRMGIHECLANELVHQYPVLYEKPGAHVIHLKSTVLISSNAIEKVTGGLPLPEVEGEVKSLQNAEAISALKTSLKLATKKKKKNKKPAAKLAHA